MTRKIPCFNLTLKETCTAQNKPHAGLESRRHDVLRSLGVRTRHTVPTSSVSYGTPTADVPTRDVRHDEIH